MLRRLLLAMVMLLVLAAAPAAASVASSPAGEDLSAPGDHLLPASGLTREALQESTPARSSFDALRVILRLALGILVAVTLLITVAPIWVAALVPRPRPPTQWRSHAAPPTRAPPSFA
jgi:hypothetical protein